MKESDNYSSNYNVAVDENTVKISQFISQNMMILSCPVEKWSKYWNDLADRYPDKKDIYAGKMRRSAQVDRFPIGIMVTLVVSI